MLRSTSVPSTSKSMRVASYFPAEFAQENAVNVTGNEGAAVLQIQEMIAGADALWRTSPNGVQHGVEKLAALGGSQSGLG
jgi:hypothetical protein